MAAVRQLPQQWKWFLAAALVLVLACVTTAQYSVSDRSSESLFGNLLVLKEGDADDADRLVALDAFTAASPADELPLQLRFLFLFSTALFLNAAYLLAFIVAPSQAPPAARSFHA